MISVIIPVLNEEKYVCSCIEGVQGEGAVREIILADGGSTDRTVELAEKYPKVRIIKAGKGRGPQMNKAASLAQGEVLLFLHADTLLERGWSEEVISFLGQGSLAGGAFTFRIDNPGKKYRFIELWVKFRCGIFKLPYGDQGIFIRKDVFEKIGGYREIPLMEDVDLVERMKGMGGIAILGKRAFIGDRRWARKGVIRVSLFNQLIMLLYRLGVNPHTLARLYYK